MSDIHSDTRIYLPPVLGRFGPRSKVSYPKFPIKALNRHLTVQQNSKRLGQKRVRFHMETIQPKRQTWVNIRESNRRIIALMKASDDGRKRIPVLPPVQRSDQKKRKRIAQAVQASLEQAQYGHWQKPTRHLSLAIDRQVIAHLRKKLIRRLERRLCDLDDSGDELDERSKHTPQLSAHRKQTIYDSKNIFSKYSEFGEKLRRESYAGTPRLEPLDDQLRKSLTTRDQKRLSPSPISENSLSNKSPLPRIANENGPAVNSSASLSDSDNTGQSGNIGTSVTPVSEENGAETPSKGSENGTNNDIVQESTDSRVAESPQGHTDEGSQEGEAQEKGRVDTTDQLKREASVFTLTKVVVAQEEELDISPVATPVMFRPLTREQTRLTFNDRMTRILQGGVHVQCPPDDKILKLYISSGFLDTEVERTVLMERVFPTLKQTALLQGYELEIYDLHWGMTDVVTDDHRVASLCLDLLQDSKESTFGTSFVVLLGEKYGSYLLPTVLPTEEFESILHAANAERERQLTILAERAAALEALKAQAQQMRMDRKAEEESQTLGVPGASMDDGRLSPRSPSPCGESPTSDGRSSPSRLRLHVDHIRKQSRVIRFFQEAQENRDDGEVIKEALDVFILETWYRLDTNLIPAVYRLQNISSQLNDFLRSDANKRKNAKNNWLAICGKLQEILQQMAKRVIKDPAARKKYFTSLLDQEIEQGLVETEDPSDRCWVMKRTIDNIREYLGDNKIKDYLDMRTNTKKPEVEDDLADRIDEIRECVILDNLDEHLIEEFTIQWNTNGVLTTGNRGHQVYLEKLSQTMLEHISDRIRPSTEQYLVDDKEKKSLYDEVSHHVRFCQESAVKFHGRKELLMRLKIYLRSPADTPLIVHGKVGTGKTALLAKAAKDSNKWFKGTDIAVIYRAIGISGESMNIRQLLFGLCQQLCEVLGHNIDDLPRDTKGILNEFTYKLSQASDDRPQMIFLDSLDRLSDENDGRKLEWMPRELPPNVHIVVSTLPDERYGCLKFLRNMFPEGSGKSYLEVPELPEDDAIVILDEWFKSHRRTLNDHQYEVVLDAFEKCPTPLFLDVVFQEVLSWPSYMDDEYAKLGETVKKIATIKLGRLEKDHGEPLVRRALGYITAARKGLSSNEIEDLLSLDEVVCEDAKSQLALPRRRIPSFLWIRLREDLKHYLMKCRADEIHTLRWRHAMFQEAAEERYLLQRDKAPSYHKAMAEYFLDKWSSIPKPYPGNEEGALRLVAKQELYTVQSETKDDGTNRIYNLRKLTELPHHLLKSQQLDVLKSEALCNFEFILAKLCATSLRELLEEYHIALSVEPTDSDLKLLSDTLQLSESALTKDPRQLGAQIAGRLYMIVSKDIPATAADPYKYPSLQELFNQISKASVPSLIPSVACLTEPGGVLFDLLCGHKDPITAVTLTTDGMRALTTGKDDTLKLWDLRSGRVVRTIEGVGKTVRLVKTGMSNSLAITSEETCIRIWSMRSGGCVHTISGFDDPAMITTASEGRLLVALFDGIGTLRVWDLENNFNLRHEIDIKESRVHQDNSAIVAGNPFGDQIIYACRGTKTAYSQNARTGRLTHTIKCQDRASLISSLAITRDYFILACKQPYMKLHEIFVLELFDIRTGKFQRSVRGCVNDNVQELFINQLGSHAIAICASEQNNMSDIALWNLETEDHKHLARHANVSTIGACLDFRFCLTAAKEDNILRIWNLSSKVNLPAPKLKKFNGIGEIVPMLDNPRYVVAKAINNGPLSVWNVAKAKCLQSAVRIERGLVESSDVLLVRNTKIIILTDRGFSSVSDDSKPVFQTVLIYNLRTKKYEKKLTGVFITPSPTNEYVLLDNDELMGLSDNRSHFLIWSLQTGRVVHRIRTNYKEVEQSRQDFGATTRDTPLVKRATTAKMMPWDRRSETDAARKSRRENEMEEERRRIEDIKKEKDNTIDEFIISEDQNVIVASFFAHHMCVFDVPGHKHIATLENDSSMLFLYTASLTVDGSYLVLANYDEDNKTSYVTLWDCHGQSVKKRLKNEANVCAIAITNNGERAVFGKSNNELRIWDPLRQNSLRKIKGYPGFNFGVGSKIFLVENDTRAVVFAGDISLWDLEEAAVLAVFTPDMKIQCCNVSYYGKVITFGLMETSDVVVLKLTSRDIQPIQDSQGEDIFGETTGDTSDEEDEEDGEDDDTK